MCPTKYVSQPVKLNLGLYLIKNCNGLNIWILYQSSEAPWSKAEKSARRLCGESALSVRENKVTVAEEALNVCWSGWRPCEMLAIELNENTFWQYLG